MTAIKIGDEAFERVQCGECGITFYVPEYWVEVRRDRGDHGATFHCPNGHSRVWREPAIDKIRRERDQLKQQQARLEDELAAQRSQTLLAEKETARIRKRISGGVCPCCNRTFQNVKRHMASKHPNVTPMPKAS